LTIRLLLLFDPYTRNQNTPSMFTLVFRLIRNTKPVKNFIFRRYLSNTTAKTGNAIYPLIGANVAVFVFWCTSDNKRFMYDNFATSGRNLTEDRWWTLVTSAFSHQHPIHLIVNMYSLKVLGTGVQQAIRVRPFILLYLMGAVGASLFHVTWQSYGFPRVVKRRILDNYSAHKPVDMSLLKLLKDPDTPALGASGSVFAIGVVFAYLFPHKRLTIFPIPFAIPARILLAFVCLGSVSLTVWGPSVSGISHMGHVGGAVAGGLFCLLMRRPLRASKTMFSIIPPSGNLKQSQRHGMKRGSKRRDLRG